MTYHQTTATAWMLMTVISLKNPEYITQLPLLPNKRETCFVRISAVQLVLHRGKRKLQETCSNSKSSLHYVIKLTQFCISVHKFVYKQNTILTADIQCLWKVPPFLVNKVPVVVIFNLLAPEFGTEILAHSVCKMWIIREPKKVALWNKRHFEEKKT